MDRHGLATYQDLVKWSIDDVSRFWDAVSRDLDLEWYTPYQQVLDLSRGVKWPRWWLGGSFNYVHNAVDKHAYGPNKDKPALICEGEEGNVRTLSYRQLYEEVNRCAAELGYWLGEPHWGKGYATEAAKLMVEYALQNFPLQRLFAWVFETNPKSARVLEKAGFQREGLLRASCVKYGERRDQLLYALVNEQWGDTR